MKLALNILITVVVTIITLTLAYNYLPIVDPITLLDENSLGATITTIQGTDTLKNSRATINTNFSNLNTEKFELSDWYATTSAPQLLSLDNLASVGTINSGIWQATDVGVAYGGTGTSSFPVNSILMGNGTNFVTYIASGTEGYSLKMVSGQPAWSSVTTDTTEDYAWTGAHSWTTGTTTFNSIATFNADIYSDTNVLALTASTTVTGASTPQPVYLATTTGAVQLVDANDDTTWYQFLGFAITSATNGNTVYVQTNGVVDGFSGLTPGAEYYASNTAGIISTTKGTVTMKLGTAISASELLITREKKLSAASASMTDNTTYTAYADAYVYCYDDTGSNVGKILAYINGALVVTTMGNAGSAENDSGATMFVGRGDTFKCDATQSLVGKYYYFN